jgi:predicted ATP-grasp superfamily ATP-dependent carboligase
MRVLVVTTYSMLERKTLCVVRSLSAKGAHVSVGADKRLCEAFYSRFCMRRVVLPHPSRGIDLFVEHLLEHLDDNEYDVLLPMCDYTTIAISLHREALETRVRVPVPDSETLMMSRDKLETLTIARRIGIEIPETHCVRQRSELETIADSIDYPCVFKLRRGVGGAGLRFPDSSEALMQCFDSLPAASDMVVDHQSPIIQEYIPGEVHDVCLLFNRGEPRAALTQKRIRTYPSTGGVGIQNQTTDEPELKDQAVRLLRALKWHGPAQVEFKIDSRDGLPKLMEVNGRYWGTLDLSRRAGIDFAFLACRLALDGDIDPVVEYEVGVTARWAFPLGLLYVMNTPGGWRSLSEIVRFEADDARWLSDPLPLLIRTLYVVGLASTRGRIRPRARVADVPRTSKA